MSARRTGSCPVCSGGDVESATLEYTVGLLLPFVLVSVGIWTLFEIDFLSARTFWLLAGALIAATWATLRTDPHLQVWWHQLREESSGQ